MIPTPSLDMKIADAYLAQGADMPAPQLYTAAAFSITGGSETFTLPTTVTGYTGNAGQAEYAGDVRIQLVSNGMYLVRRTREQIESRKQGSTTLLTGVPQEFALHVLANATVAGIVYPAAAATESCNFFRSLALDDLRDYVGSGANTLDDVSVQMSRIGVVALVYHVAALLVAEMTPDNLAKRSLNPNIASAWEKISNDALYQDIANHHALESTGEFQEWTASPTPP